METAENYWIKYSQHDCFESEMKIIEHGKQLSTKNNLQSLNPFIDDCGLFRLGGRHDKCGLAYSNRYPMILSGKHIITQLIIRREHNRWPHINDSISESQILHFWHS